MTRGGRKPGRHGIRGGVFGGDGDAAERRRGVVTGVERVADAVAVGGGVEAYLRGVAPETSPAAREHAGPRGLGGVEKHQDAEEEVVVEGAEAVLAAVGGLRTLRGDLAAAVGGLRTLRGDLAAAAAASLHGNGLGFRFGLRGDLDWRGLGKGERICGGFAGRRCVFALT